MNRVHTTTCFTWSKTSRADATHLRERHVLDIAPPERIVSTESFGYPGEMMITTTFVEQDGHDDHDLR